ncbi:MAG: hypothetical protein F6K26_48265 [Moorea sp. SIO2I5]|nr:hypothetical protein [Moorena sp. SIO2I5]
MVIGFAFAHPTPQQMDPIRVKIPAFAHPTPQVWWANEPDSITYGHWICICPPYATT